MKMQKPIKLPNMEKELSAQQNASYSASVVLEAQYISFTKV
jgi:hypothetical protein